MAALSRCELRNSSRALVRPGAVFCLMSLLIVLVGMALAQLELRFETRDFDLETRKLQKERADLLARQKVLASELKQMKRYDTVRQYAMEQLGLRECPARSKQQGGGEFAVTGQVGHYESCGRFPVSLPSGNRPLRKSFWRPLRRRFPLRVCQWRVISSLAHGSFTYDFVTMGFAGRQSGCVTFCCKFDQAGFCPYPLLALTPVPCTRAILVLALSLLLPFALLLFPC